MRVGNRESIVELESDQKVEGILKQRLPLFPCPDALEIQLLQDILGEAGAVLVALDANRQTARRLRR